MAVTVFALFVLFWLVGRRGGGGGSADSIIGTGPEVVVVTVLDPSADAGWTDKIRHNREEYAKRHGVFAHGAV